MKSIHVLVALSVAMPAFASAQAERGGQQNPNRAAMEQRVRERMASMIQKRLGLNDEQMKKLAETNRRFDERRRLLHDQERDIRMGMRDEMLRGDTANQAKVGDYLDRLLKVQRQRLELVEQEQKDLSGYLTPVQRVRFHALQNEMRKFRDDAQRRRGGDNPGPRSGRAGQRGRRAPDGPPNP